MIVTNENGWHGAFTRNQAEGAIANGTRVRKAVAEKGDAHGIGALATVLGSIGLPEEIERQLGPALRGVKIAYFVEWDDYPKTACGVMDYKIEPV